MEVLLQWEAIAYPAFQTSKNSAPEHEVTVFIYAMSEAEITNTQYVDFLNTILA